MRQFLASAFAWNISVRSMQACASVFASCSLLPPRILYYKPWIRVYARKNVLPDPRKSQNRVSDGKLYLSDPQNNKMVDITAMQKRKTGLRRQIVSLRPATTQNAVFITSFSAASSQNQFFITSFPTATALESVFIDLTVHNSYHTARMFCHIQIMGNHHNGISHLIQIFKKLQYLFSTVHIERACRLICK